MKAVLVAFAVLWIFACGSTSAADVTASVAIQRSGFVFNRSTTTFDATVTITNTSQASLGAPINLVVTVSNPAVTVSNKTGITADGKPYIQFPLLSGTLNQGQSSTLVLKTNNANRAQFMVTLAVEAQSQPTRRQLRHPPQLPS